MACKGENVLEYAYCTMMIKKIGPGKIEIYNSEVIKLEEEGRGEHIQWVQNIYFCKLN